MIVARLEPTGFSDFTYRYEAQIRILDVRGNPHHLQGREERHHNYLEILVHECVHAILGLYTCMMHWRCRLHDKRVVGKHGHLKV